ncbi:hypothetical protein [Herbaspirillum sp. ST 5-3]|uniref:hypothetical protein n=1 Tax=Oxalobacteraceae TaxID=75682 RepID=UPI0010A4CCFB|nr:hypothetical protein [Herbaspirillum sp. ST 5-3]
MEENKNGFIRPDGKKIIQVLVEPEKHRKLKSSKIKIQPLFNLFIDAILENNEDGLIAGDFVTSYVEKHKEELTKELLAKLHK